MVQVTKIVIKMMLIFLIIIIVIALIKNDIRIAEIISLQISILKAFGNVKSNDFLSEENLAYVSLVADAG